MRSEYRSMNGSRFYSSDPHPSVPKHDGNPSPPYCRYQRRSEESLHNTSVDEVVLVRNQRVIPVLLFYKTFGVKVCTYEEALVSLPGYMRELSERAKC